MFQMIVKQFEYLEDPLDPDQTLQNLEELAALLQRAYEIWDTICEEFDLSEEKDLGKVDHHSKIREDLKQTISQIGIIINNVEAERNSKDDEQSIDPDPFYANIRLRLKTIVRPSFDRANKLHQGFMNVLISASNTK